jgi:hypothetical protein
MTDKFHIVLECGDIDDDDVKRLKKEFKTKYNVNFTFKPRKYDLHYADWIFTGTREDVKRFIIEDYLPNAEIDINDLDEDYDSEILDLIRN